jgi:hypothetical protein
VDTLAQSIGKFTLAAEQLRFIPARCEIVNRSGDYLGRIHCRDPGTDLCGRRSVLLTSVAVPRDADQYEDRDGSEIAEVSVRCDCRGYAISGSTCKLSGVSLARRPDSVESNSSCLHMNVDGGMPDGVELDETLQKLGLRLEANGNEQAGGTKICAVTQS